MSSNPVYTELTQQLKTWAYELGFQHLGISDTQLYKSEQDLEKWLANNYHGDMQWMAEHGTLRSRPEELLPGTIRVICVRMDYLPADTEQVKILKEPEKAYISRYALGRDYHKLIRKRLSHLAKKLEAAAKALNGSTDINQRAFVDSAPVLERALAEKAGLGWVGKHTLVLHEKAGSWFFLGEIYTNIPLELDKEQAKNRCGDCNACLKVCPTDAFPKPYVLDARRCISYLTIENKHAIPKEFREPIGNRVFGCDDCQLVCPWNKYAKPTSEDAFKPRHGFDHVDLIDLFLWSEQEFLKNTEGSPIRRIGYERWIRNLAVGLGNAPRSNQIVSALKQKKTSCSAMVKEHIDWAIKQQEREKYSRKRKIKNI